MLYPLTFISIFKERIWGGRKLEELFHKNLPPGLRIGESWEISDRPGDVSVVANGPLAGKTLHWLVENHREELLGSAPLQNGRFPLLIKILDAREKLSVQVHPPQHVAPSLGGEPKTELWYIVDAEPEAELHVGLKQGMKRDRFEQHIAEGSVANCVHRLKVEAGDAMFLPSGRIHAIGAGLVLIEIQQNSDTTYRVFDWNRLGLDGKPRALHVNESLASIDFDDFEPAAIRGTPEQERQLVEHALFQVRILQAHKEQRHRVAPGRMRVVGVVKGKVGVRSKVLSIELKKGEFCLIPAAIEAELELGAGSSLIQAWAGAESG